MKAICINNTTRGGILDELTVGKTYDYSMLNNSDKERYKRYGNQRYIEAGGKQDVKVSQLIKVRDDSGGETVYNVCFFKLFRDENLKELLS
jgi:hypothetical protein